MPTKCPKELAQQFKRERREAEDREREKNIREKLMKEFAAMLSSSESETEEAPVTTFSPSPAGAFTSSPSPVPAARKPGSGPADQNADPCNLPPLPEIENIEQPETIFVDLTADSDDENETISSEGNPDLIIISDSDEF